MNVNTPFREVKEGLFIMEQQPSMCQGLIILICLVGLPDILYRLILQHSTIVTNLISPIFIQKRGEAPPDLFCCKVLIVISGLTKLWLCLFFLSEKEIIQTANFRNPSFVEYLTTDKIHFPIAKFIIFFITVHNYLTSA